MKFYALKFRYTHYENQEWIYSVPGRKLLFNTMTPICLTTENKVAEEIEYLKRNLLNWQTIEYVVEEYKLSFVQNVVVELAEETLESIDKKESK